MCICALYLQEVITNEHVVAMMKAAITESEAIPIFVSFHNFRMKPSDAGEYVIYSTHYCMCPVY